MKKLLFRIFFLMAVVGSAFVGGVILDRENKLPTWATQVLHKVEQNDTESTLDKHSFRDTEECNEPIPDIAERASKSVVTVSIKKVGIDLPKGGMGLWPFGIMPQGEPRYKEIEQDIGTGFVVGEDHLVITNKHVVADTQAKYKVIDKDNKEYEVTKIYRDPMNDIAILKVEGLNLPPLPLGDSDKLRVGESVIAIGTALGEFRHTVTTGVISGLGRGIVAGDAFGQAVESLENIIQTDAAINPGNSGGPLLNRCGEVIGVNVAVSRNAENIGFAIPINEVKETLENFTRTGKFDRAFLGVRYINISEKTAIRNEIPQGAYVTEVIPGSSADEAGIKPGDIITEFNGKKLTKHSLAELVAQTKIGDKVKVKIYRWGDDKSMELSVKMKGND